MFASPQLPVYLDHNATTPMADCVREAMLPWLGQPANPSSRHEYGRQALEALRVAREQVACAVGAHPSELVFTSGGSAANNALIKGWSGFQRPGTFLCSAIEHPSVSRTCAQLSSLGWTVKSIPVNEQCQIDEVGYGALLTERPSAVSIMMANNETGVVQDVAGLAESARSAGVRCFHVDAVQALGKIPVNFRELNRAGVHALCVSGHKVEAPAGVGALVLDKRLDLQPWLAGGGQERGLFSGTENLAAIVGFGAACEHFLKNGVHTHATRLLALRTRLEKGLLGLGAVVFALSAPRLPNTVFFAMPGVDGETLVGQLDRAGFAVASGSACSSAQPEPSHVLSAMGVDSTLAKCAVRVSAGRLNTEQQIDDFLVSLTHTVQKLKTMTAIAV